VSGGAEREQREQRQRQREAERGRERQRDGREQRQRQREAEREADVCEQRSDMQISHALGNRNRLMSFLTWRKKYKY
jgi:hypothetical protein